MAQNRAVDLTWQPRFGTRNDREVLLASDVEWGCV